MKKIKTNNTIDELTAASVTPDASLFYQLFIINLIICNNTNDVGSGL